MSGRVNRRVTSIDVARAADVSQATVSRVFAAPHLVTDQKRRRVYQAAEELGYVPNAIARSLSSHSSRIIAVVVPSASEYYQHALGEFTRQIVPKDYQLLLFESFEQADLEVVFTSIPRYHVDAVIVASSIVPVRQVQPLVEQGYPVLMFNQVVDANQVMSVSVDNEAGTRALAGLLVDTGHSSVCFLGGLKYASTDQARYRGAVERLAEAEIPCRYVLAGAYDYDHGYQAAAQVATLGVDAVMAGSDIIAFGLIDGLRDLGTRVPEDISVTGFDGLPQAAWTAYNLTTIDQPMSSLASIGIDMVVARIEGGGPEADHHVLPGTLRRRASVADRSQPLSLGSSRQPD